MIRAISSIHLLVTFMNAPRLDDKTMLWQTIIHLTLVLSAIAIAVGKPRQWVDELAADQAIVLAAKVIEVNADFFTRTVMPKLDGLLGQARSLAPPVQMPTQATGSTPSNG